MWRGGVGRFGEARNSLYKRLTSGGLEGCSSLRSERGFVGELDAPTSEEIDRGTEDLISTRIGWLIPRKKMHAPGTHEKVLEILDLLLQNGVCPSSKNIIHALVLKELDILKKFNDAGAKVTDVEIKKSSVEANCEEKMLAYLYETNQYDVNAVIRGMPRICSAALGMNTKLIGFLLQRNVNLNVKATTNCGLFFKRHYDDPVIKDFFDKYVSGKSPIELCSSLVSIDELLKSADDPAALRAAADESRALFGH